jgi:hypothetical protein
MSTNKDVKLTPNQIKYLKYIKPRYEDPVYREKANEASRISLNKRYKNDVEYRESKKAYKREHYSTLEKEKKKEDYETNKEHLKELNRLNYQKLKASKLAFLSLNPLCIYIFFTSSFNQKENFEQFLELIKI